MNSIRDLPTPTTVSTNSGDHWDHKVDSGGFSELIAQAWRKRFDTTNDEHAVPGTRHRGSNAGNCLRQLYYYGSGEPPSDPPTVADLFRMNVGKVLHGWIQTPEIWGDTAEFEPVWHDKAMDMSGRGDVFLPESKTMVELKTAGGYKFKKAGVFNNSEGPSEENLRQLGLACEGRGATTGILMQIGLEVVNKGDTNRYGITDNQRWLSEWVYDYETDLKPRVEDERRRIAVVNEAINAGDPPARHCIGMPDGASITKPKPNSGNPIWTVVSDGVVVDQGTTWQCDYCRFQTKCADDAAKGI